MSYDNDYEQSEGMFPDINSSYKRMSNADIGVPVKKMLKNQRVQMITSNPQNVIGNEYLREKFKLPDPNKGKKQTRQIGGPSNVFSSKPIVKTTRPKRILPKKIRDDPLADGPKITEDDLCDGMFSLITRGIIPRGVDVTPAFERGKPPFEFTSIKIQAKIDKASFKYSAPAIMYKKPNSVNAKRRGPNTFITSDDMYENMFLNEIKHLNSGTLSKESLNKSQKDLIRNQDQRGSNENIISNQLVRPQEMSPALLIDHTEDHEENLDLYATQDNQTTDLGNLYSMYQIVIKGGKVIESAPEYLAFKRANILNWGAVSLIIYMLEKLLNLYHVPNAVIDGAKVVMLAEEELNRPEDDELLQCVINRSQVIDIIKNPRKKFKGPKGPELASIWIQKNWRRFKAYTAFTLLKFSMSKATIIQRKWRLYQLMKNTKQKIKQFNEESMSEWRIMMKEFRKRWPEIKKKRRVEIHINSFSFSEQKRLTMEKFKQRENSQISRIFSVKDPKVDVIYIAPFTLTNEVYEYYKKILELGELEKPENRFHVVVPENYVKFKETMSLTQTLLYSPKAIKRIKSLINERQAYIVPGFATGEDIKLSITLGIPIQCGDPSKVSIYSTKSGAKRIFQQADVPSPISAYDIYEKREFELSLSRLIAHNLYVNTWIFKIDDEFNGRGHASLNIESIKAVVELRK